jgi:Sec-independent protein secretion pathway component TatC
MSLSLKIAEMLSKLHFMAALAMFFFIALMVVSDDMAVRALLLVPVVLLFALSKLMYSIDQKTSTDEIIKHYKKR